MLGDLLIRPMCEPDDQDFDLSVYAFTRLDELAGLGWTTDQVDQFIRMQYQAQALHYRRHFPAQVRRAGSLTAAEFEAALGSGFDVLDTDGRVILSLSLRRFRFG